jgi:uncharacterized protein (TIGR00369 family)
VTRHRRRLEAWKRGELELAPVAQLLGLLPVEIEDGLARVAMPAGAAHHNAFGAVHGGLLCALADVAMGVALATLLEDDEGFATLEQHIDHLRPVRESRLLATARVARRGRAAGHVQCEIEDGEGRLLARATCVCLIVRGEGPEAPRDETGARERP